jgi:hypothetical protein
MLWIRMKEDRKQLREYGWLITTKGIFWYSILKGQTAKSEESNEW